MASTTTWMESRGAATALFILMATLYSLNLGLPELSDVDESRSGCIVRDMVEGGRWLLPRTPDGFLGEKPPAYYFSAAALGTLFGINEWTLRSVSVAAGVGTLALTLVLGRMIGGRRAGTISMLVLASNALFIEVSRTARVDMVLTFFITAGFVAIIAGRSGRLGIQASAILSGLAWGGAVLSKGPVGVAVPAAALAAEVLLETRGRFWKGLAWKPLALGAGTLALVVATFYIPALVRGGREFLETSILSENFYMPIGRSRGLGVGHEKHFLFYIVRQALVLVPAVPLLPALAGRWAGPESRWLLRLWIWAGAGFLVFQAAANKRAYYLVPLQPLLAAGIGAAYARTSAEEVGGWRVIPAGVAGVLLLISIPAVPTVASLASLPIPAHAVAIGAVLAALSAMALLGACRLGFKAVAAGFTVLALAIAALPGVLVDPLRSSANRTKRFVAECVSLLPQNEVPAVAGRLYGYAVDFYWPVRLIRDPSKEKDAGYLLVRRGTGQPVERLGDVLVVWHCGYADRDILLVRRRMSGRSN